MRLQAFRVSTVLGHLWVCSALILNRGDPSTRESEPQDRPTQPHIIFVLADDLGWHDVGISGGDIPTPNIDKLASEGVMLTNHYVLPTCAPTRASLMTGLSPVRHGVLLPYAHETKFNLPTSLTTMADVLAKAGYETHMVGKWHLGFWKEEYTPTFRGFKSFYGFYGMGERYWDHQAKSWLTNTFAYDFRREEGARCGKNCSIIEDVRDKYGTTVLNQRAKEVVQQHDANKPLFLYFAWQAVHAPRQCPDEFGYNGTRNSEFACMLGMADEGIGDLVEALKIKNMLQDTVFVFSSDNGGPISTGTHAEDDIGSSNWPLRGGKHNLFEGGTRATSFVWAGWHSWSSSYDGLMGVSDWLPTLATLASAEFPDGLDGKDQWLAMTQGTDSPHDHLVTAMTYTGKPPEGQYNWALRKGKWKLIHGIPGLKSQANQGWSGPSGSDLSAGAENISSAVLLYDLSNDEREQTDLSKERPDKVRELLRVLWRYQLQEHHVPAVCADGDRLMPIETALGSVWAPVA